MIKSIAQFEVTKSLPHPAPSPQPPTCSLARFVTPGVVMMSKPFPAPADDTESQVWIQQYEQARGVLNSAADARGCKLQILELPEPDPYKVRQLPAKDIACCKQIGLDCKNGGLTSYVNFYIVNGGILMPEFGGKEADGKAWEILEVTFPSRKVVAVNFDYVAVGDRGIHHATHEFPKA